MDDPARLLEGEATELERTLLAAAAREMPAPELTAQMRAAIGLGTGAPAAAPAARLGVKMWGSIGAVALVAGGIALLVARRAPAPPAAPLPPAVRVPPPPAPVEPEPAAPAATAPIERPTTVRRSVRADVAARTASPAPASDLPDEIRRLDRARVALNAGQARRALHELDDYAERHPAGALRQEAAVLRIEAVDRSGNRERAAAMARAFAAEHPGSPLLERLRRFDR